MKGIIITAAILVLAALVIIGILVGLYWLGSREISTSEHFRDAYDSVFWLMGHLKNSEKANERWAATIVSKVLDALVEAEKKAQEE